MRCNVRIFQILLLIVMINCTVVAAQEPPPAKVVVAEIGQQEVAENQSFIGLLYYDRISNVSSEVSGLVERIEVNEGDRIEKGTPLVRMLRSGF